MCTEKLLLENGLRANCGRCEQCRKTAKNDLVGRCIAEAKVTPGQAHFVTLTYGNDMRIGSNEVRSVPGALSFIYEHTVEWRRRLLRYSDGFRWFIVGEAGEEKGRIHWHGLIFWKGQPVPNLGCNGRYNHWVETPAQAQLRTGDRRSRGIPLWPHGFSDWQPLSHVKQIEYLAKYMLKKNVLDGTVMDELKHRGLASQPPMGSEYFRRLAHRLVDAQLPIRDFFYWFADVTYADGTRRNFLMPKGRSRDLFLGEYVRYWRLRHGNDRWPRSEPIDLYMDKIEGHYSGKFFGVDAENHFYMQQQDRPGRFLPLLRTDSGGRRWQVKDIGNDMDRFDETGWVLPAPKVKIFGRDDA